MSVPYRKISPFITYTPKYIDMISDPNYFKVDLDAVEFAKFDTVWTLLTHRAKEIPNDPLFGTRQYDKEAGKFTDYKFISYSETVKIVEQYASGLVELGLKKGDVCTEIFGNRVEWVIHDLALFRHNATASPLRHGLNNEYYKRIITLTEPTLAIVSADNVDTILDICDLLIKDSNPPNYKFIVVMPQPMGPLYGTESVKPAQFERAKSLGFRLIKWEDVMELGKAHPHPQDIPDPLAVHSIPFTSGTTSDQLKGVLVTQRGMTAFQARFTHYQHYTFYSYVHMSHMSDRSMIAHTISTKSCIGFASGSKETFLDDVEALHPTLLPLVPAFLKTIQSKVFDLIRSGVSEETAKAIFRKKFGGKLIRCVNFGAPCPEDLCKWAIDFLDVEFTSFYALTEAGACVSSIPFSRNPIPFGCIGQPSPLALLRIIDAPEAGCSIHDDPPRGELLIRSPGNMLGYLKNPEKTKAALDDEAFLHTSDLVQLNDDGTLTIIDRRDNMLKLADAAYVPPEKIESFLGTSHLVTQSWVHSRHQDAFVVTVVVPNLAVLANDPRVPADLKELAIAAAKNPEGPEAEKLCGNEKIVKIFVDEFAEIGKKNHFPDHWAIKGVLLEPVRWTEAGGLITVTNKLKRRALITKYTEKIDDLVAAL